MDYNFDTLASDDEISLKNLKLKIMSPIEAMVNENDNENDNEHDNDNESENDNDNDNERQTQIAPDANFPPTPQNICF